MAASLCPSPLLPQTPLTGAAASQTQRLLASRICVEGCCISCYESFNDAATQRLNNATYISSFVVFFVALFILITYLVNPRLTINKYAGIQAASIVLVTGVTSFTPFALHDGVVCHDNITPNNGFNSNRCMAEAVLFSFGELMMVFSLTMRIFTVFLKVVFKTRDINWYVCLAIIIVPSAILAGVGARNVDYEGGSMCTLNSVTTWWQVKVPQLIVSFIGIVLLIIIVLYVTSIIMQVSLDVDQAKVGNKSFTVRRMWTCVKAFFRSILLLWRTFFCATFLASLIITNFFFRSYPWSHVAPITGQRTLEWAQCILNNANRFATEGELFNYCAPADRARGLEVYERRTITNLVFIFQVAFFLLSEFQVLMFVGWYRILKSPSAIFLRSRSNAILDSLENCSSSPNNRRGDDSDDSDADPTEHNELEPTITQRRHSDAELEELQTQMSRMRRPSIMEKFHHGRKNRPGDLALPSASAQPQLFVKAQSARINRDMKHMERALDAQLARYEMQRRGSHDSDLSRTSTIASNNSHNSDNYRDHKVVASRAGSEGQDTLVDPVEAYKSIQQKRQSSQDSGANDLGILDFLKFNP
ncbi:hypothetical protein TRVA0_047S00650 [Trichomonascus vanleenenianus]|uniref:uncharacterized protein n=1 Tax=Trichomonascus vanleenenianus TaxID=2268995 RepID=UPI003ECB3416